MELTFRRIIVYPDGHQHIEGKTPKQLPVLVRRRGGRGVGYAFDRTGTCALILPTPTEIRVSVSENFKI